MTKRRSLLALCYALCLSLLFAPRAAVAQSEPASTQKAPDANAKKEAARRFEHAIKLYEDADYALALAEFERVYELVPDYRVLYNISQVSMQMGRYARALRTLREYVSRGGNELPGDRRTAAQADLAWLEARTATLKVDVQPEGAEVSIDAAVVGKSPLGEPLVVDVGERRVQARLSGHRTISQTLTLAGGDFRQVTLMLAPEPSAGAPGTEPPQPRAQPLPDTMPPAPAPERRSAWLWVGWGATATLAVSSAVSAVLGASAASDLDGLRDSRTATRTSLDDAQSRAKTRLLVADVLGAAAVVTGATTLYFQLSRPSARERPAAATRLGLAVRPNGLSLRVEH